MEKPLFPLALVPLAVGLVLISVAIGSKTGKEDTQKDSSACLLGAHGCRRRVEDNKLTRSTGAKGCSPDNAAVEGFFGRPRQEFFHKRSFAGVSMDGFIDMLNDYMVWYRDKRIKTEYGTGIMDRRRKLGLVA